MAPNISTKPSITSRKEKLNRSLKPTHWPKLQRHTNALRRARRASVPSSQCNPNPSSHGQRMPGHPEVGSRAAPMKCQLPAGRQSTRNHECLSFQRLSNQAAQTGKAGCAFGNRSKKSAYNLSMVICRFVLLFCFLHVPLVVAQEADVLPEIKELAF